MNGWCHFSLVPISQSHAFLNQLEDLSSQNNKTADLKRNKNKGEYKIGEETQCCLLSDTICFARRGDVKQSFGEDSRNICS